MKRYLLLIFLIFSSALFGQKFNLIPQPVQVEEQEGFFELTNNTFVTYNDLKIRNTAEYFLQKIKPATGLSLKADQGINGSIQMNLNKSKDPQLGKEGYKLESSSAGVTISANEPAGLFYGIQTLIQLLPKEIEAGSIVNSTWKIPSVKIVDYPRFPWRGIMLDVARHFFSKQDVKTFIDQLARLKYNVFHWHLTDDEGWRIEIKALPKLTEVGAWRVKRNGKFGERERPRPGEKAAYGGYYTHEDIKEIVKFAAERNITVVPEIDIPGHSMAFVASYPEVSCTKDTAIKVNPGMNFATWYGNGTFQMFVDNTLNPSEEKVYEYLDKIFTEVASLFPGEYIHAGGDECYKGFWKNDPGCKALMKKLKIRHIEDLQGYFMGRVQKILSAKGKKLLGWDEILEGGVNPDAAVMSWRGLEAGIEASNAGHNVIMTPTSYVYLDYNQGDQTVDPPIYSGLRLSKTYSFEPVPEGANGKYILGGQGNLWTEQIETLKHAEYMVYPRAWAISEVLWSPKEARNYNNFVTRMEDHFLRSEAAGINYSKAVYDPVVKTRRQDGKLMLVIESEIPDADVYYTMDGSMPNNLYSTKYTGPVEIPAGPVAVRVQGYRNGELSGHLITLTPDEVRRRTDR